MTSWRSTCRHHRELWRRPADGPVARSNPAVNVLLHPVRHLDQTPPRPFKERHHTIHVAIARQWNFEFALTLVDLRIRFPKRVRFWQGPFDLAVDRGLTRGQFGLELLQFGFCF